MRPSLVIVNYNGSRYLPTTLAEIDLDEFEAILLVDNASTDGSPDWVREHHPDVRVIERATNDGPGHARETGLRAAPTDRVVLIDNDVVPQKGCVAALMRALDENPRAILAMPRVVYDEQPDLCQFDGAGAHCSGLMIIENGDTPVADLPAEPRGLDSVIGACMLTDRARWGGQGFCEDLFFVYYEDHELGLRARLLGFDVLAVPDAWVRHGAGTVGMSIRETGQFTPRRIRNTILGRWRVLGKLYRLRTLVLLSPALVLFETAQFAGAIYKGWLRHYLYSVATLLRELPRLWRKRRAFQRQRQRPDRDVLRSGPLPFHPKLLKGGFGTFVRWTLEFAFDLNWALIRRWV